MFPIPPFSNLQFRMMQVVIILGSGILLKMKMPLVIVKMKFQRVSGTTEWIQYRQK